MALSSDLDLHSVLARIVESAATLTGARYGALGVLGHDEHLGDFITTGIPGSERLLIGDLPHGRGILGLLIDERRLTAALPPGRGAPRLGLDEPQPLRLHDLTQHPASYGFPENHPPMSSF